MVSRSARLLGFALAGAIVSGAPALAQPAPAQPSPPQPLPNQPAPPQSAPPQSAQIRFEYENPGLVPARYVITVTEDGTGTFRADPSPVPPLEDQTRATLREIEIYNAFELKITVTEALRRRLFEMARAVHLFRDRCEYGGHRIAFQGTKKLSYQAPAGSADAGGECTFNWSEDKRIQQFTDDFEAMATTIVEGRKLQVLLTHERLGLDPEMQYLVEQVKAKRAVQLKNILGVLQAIQQDPQVIDRIRKKALELSTFAVNEP